MYTEQQFRNKITIYSFLAIIAVVFIHTYNLAVYHISEDSVGFSRFVFYFESVAASLWGAAVPMFFLISGFLLFRNFTWDKLWSKYQTRFHTVLIPYLVSAKYSYANHQIRSHLYHTTLEMRAFYSTITC